MAEVKKLSCKHFLLMVKMGLSGKLIKRMRNLKLVDSVGQRLTAINKSEVSFLKKSNFI